MAVPAKRPSAKWTNGLRGCDPLDLLKALTQELSVVQVGMLGVQGAPLPFRPMAHLVGPGAGTLWFLAETDTDLVRAVEASGAQAFYCLTGRNHDRYACLSGAIRTVPDRQGLERVWSITAEALFPGGLTDIEWMPLCLKLDAADIWAEPRTAVLAGMDAITSAFPEEPPAERLHGRFTF